MITMVDKNSILLRYFRDGESMSSISRSLNLSRTTVTKYVNAHKELLSSGKVKDTLSFSLSTYPEYNSSNRTKRRLTTDICLLIKECLLENEKKRGQGLHKQLMKTIDRIKNNLNPDLSIRGILLTMYDKRNKLSGQVEQEARDYFKEIVYQTVVPRNVRLSEAPSHGMPVLLYDKSCPGSKSYFSFTNEFINQEKIMESAA